MEKMFPKTAPSHRLGTPPHSFVQRVERLFKNKNSKNHFENKLGSTTPHIQKKLDILTTSRGNKPLKANKTFYEKYSRIWKKPKQNKASALALHQTLSKLQLKLVVSVFSELKPSQTQPNPLAAVKCPKCSYAGLQLLTSSTKENISPRFMDKIKLILPSAQEFSATRKFGNSRFIQSNTATENSFPEGGSPEPQDFRKPQVKKISDLGDISEIPFDPLEISSLGSPDLASSRQFEHKPPIKYEQSLRKPRDEVSFEVQGEATELPKPQEDSKQRYNVPRLNFSELVASKQTKKGNFSPEKMSIEVLTGSPTPSKNELRISKGLQKAAHENSGKLSQKENEEYSLTFEFSREEIDYRKPKNPMTSTFGNNQMPKICNLSAIERKNSRVLDDSLFSEYEEPSKTAKTAYRIFHSKLAKFIYRRKVVGFYALSQVLFK